MDENNYPLCYIEVCTKEYKMKRLLTIIALNAVLAFAAQLSAEVFENEVEYTLPSTDQKWKVGYELKNDKIKMVAFIPENEDKESATESFAISVVKGQPDQPTKPEEGIKTFLKSLAEREGVEIETKVISSSDKEAIVEWWTKDGKSHNWVRGITGPDEIITIMYTTRSKDKVEQAAKNWLPVISGAKVLEPAKS
jgi:hypothetical protein